MFEQQQDPKYFKESGKVVNNFIRRKSEKAIKRFFLEDIDKLLSVYEPGRPNMKPDVLKQIKEIEAKRDEMKKAMLEKQQENGPIILNRPEGQMQLSNKQVVEIIKQQQVELEKHKKDKQEMDRLSELMKHKLVDLHNKTVSLRKEKEALERVLKESDIRPPPPIPAPQVSIQPQLAEAPQSFTQPMEDGTSPTNKSEPVV